MSTVRKKTKATCVFEQLQTDIQSGVFKSDEKLSMDILKERYGVGYSPLREALSRLAANGSVNFVEQCGFYVAPLSTDELHDLYKIRSALENIALELAIERGDSQWEADIIVAWHHYANYLNPKNKNKYDPETWGRLQRAFRTSLVKGCNSSWLLKMREMLHEQAARYRNVCLANHFNNEKLLLAFMQENEALATAVLARDKEQAILLSQKTWDGSVNAIAEAIKKNN